MSLIMKNCIALTVIGLLAFVLAEKIDPPIPCSNTADCLHFSKTLKDPLCKDGFCICNIGMETKNCSSIAALRADNGNSASLIHRACKHDQDCNFQRGFCNTTISQCDCQRNYVVSSNKQVCLEKASAIDYPCIDEKQCLAFLPNTTCHAGQCICATGYHYVDDFCHRTVGFGNTCTKTQECSHIEGAVCTEKMICGCPAEKVINMDSKRCLPVAQKILDECKENVQCSTTFSDALCIDQQCQCREGYHYESDMSRCFVNRALDEDCGNSYECYQAQEEGESETGKALQCLSNKCVCAENYYKEEDKCVNAAPLVAGSTPLFIILFIFLHTTFS